MHANYILFLKDLKDSTRKLLELINRFSKIAGYKINIENSDAFLYANKKHIQNEIREAIPSIIVPNIYVEINLIFFKIYSEIFKTLKIEIEGIRRCKDIPCSWISIINI